VLSVPQSITGILRCKTSYKVLQWHRSEKETIKMKSCSLDI